MDRDRNFPPHPSGVREPIFPANFWHQRHYVPCRHHLLRTWNERFPHTSARRPERNRILLDVLTCPLSRGTCWAAEIDAFRYGRPKAATTAILAGVNSRNNITSEICGVVFLFGFNTVFT